MKKLAMVILLTLFAGAAEIKDIFFAKEAIEKKDGNGYDVKGITSNFAPETRNIFALVEFDNAKKNEHLKVSFIAVDAISVPNYKIADVDVALPVASGTARASLSPGNNPFPTGNYRVDVYRNDKVIASKPFTVSKMEEQHAGIGAAINKPNQQNHSLPKIETITLSAKIKTDSMGDEVPTEGRDRFYPNQHKIYAAIDFTDAKKDDTVTIKWILEKSKEYQNYEVLKLDLALDKREGTIYSDAEVPTDWPVGKYSIEIYSGDELLSKKEFYIDAPAAQQAQNNAQIPSAPATNNINDKLIGKWMGSIEGKAQSMEIFSGGQMRYNGISLKYELDGDKIVVIDGKNRSPYRYKLEGGKLTLRFPDGLVIVFGRENRNTGQHNPLGAAANLSTVQQPANQNQATPPPSSIASASQFKRLYCSNSADGAEWAKFADHGVFYFGSLSDLNMPYGKGSYKVMGNSIKLLFDGERSNANIMKRNPDNTITDISYDGIIYSSELCR